MILYGAAVSQTNHRCCKKKQSKSQTIMNHDHNLKYLLNLASFRKVFVIF